MLSFVWPLLPMSGSPRAITRAYGNEERDRRVEVVKLLTASSYCVGATASGSSLLYRVFTVS